MKTKLCNFLAVGLSLGSLLFAAPVAAMPSLSTGFASTTPTPTPTPTPTLTLKSSACDGLSSLDSTQGCGASSDKTIMKIVAAVVTVLSTIVGIAAVIVVLMSGFKYITSGGDAGKISSAKNTLVYALVGLAVAVLAQFIVHFTIKTATDATACPVGQHLDKDGVTCAADKVTP